MNKNLSLAIVDDDARTRIIIAEKIRSLYPSLNVSTSLFSNADEYYSSLSDNTYDLTFLDIEMPEVNGIQLARKLKEEERDEKIVFVSNREDKVFDSLATRPYGFVRKSHFERDIQKIVDYYLEKREEESKEDYLHVQKEGKEFSLKTAEILYIDSRGKSQYIYLVNGNSYAVRLTLRELEEKLEPIGFINCCKGILVNAYHIKMIETDSLTLDNGKVLPVARRRNAETKEKYFAILKDRLTPIY